MAGPLSEDDAVALFLARAGDVRGAPVHEDVAIARGIVRRLALGRAAILLAAARADVQSLEEIAETLDALEGAELPHGDLRARLARAEEARFAGRLPEAERALLAIIDDAARDPHGAAEAHRVLGSVLRAQGRFADALVHKERALSLARSLGDEGNVARSMGEVGTALAGLGRLREARGAHEEALARHRLLGRTRAEALETSYLGVVLQRLGLLEEARRTHARALALHHAVGHARLEAAERLHMGVTEHELGALEAAAERLDEAADALRRVGDEALVGVARTHAGLVDAERGHFESAGASLREGLALAKRAGSPRHEAMAWLGLAMVHDALGEAAELGVALDRALALGAGRVEIEHEAWMRGLAASAGRGPEPSPGKIIALEDRLTARGLAILASGRAEPGDAEAPGSRVRFAARHVRALAPRAPVLRLDAAGRWFELGGARADLGRRRPLRLLLLRLVEHRDRSPGESLSWQALLEAGWPGEKVLAEAGFGRVRNAVAQLRTLGLRDVLRTTGEGYALDPDLRVERQTEL